MSHQHANTGSTLEFRQTSSGGAYETKCSFNNNSNFFVEVNFSLNLVRGAQEIVEDRGVRVHL